MGIPSNTSPSANDAAVRPDLAEELQQWIKRERALMDIFLDACCIVDAANRVVDFNVAFTELCGESYRKVLRIGDFCTLVKTELCPGQCPARQIATSHRALRLDELGGATKAFPNLQMIVGGIPILSERNEYLGALITIRNVSAESELQKKYDERKKESVTDGLTRLYNKVFIESCLLRSVKAASSVSVVMCDIDKFKLVNDTHGHPAGDAVLQSVAQVLRGAVRESDIVGRMGGEEFLAVLPNTDAKGALIFAERFRKKVEATEIFFEGKRIPVTISLGTASIRSATRSDASPEAITKDLISRADEALYRAKANGRNQTCQSE